MKLEPFALPFENAVDGLHERRRNRCPTRSRTLLGNRIRPRRSSGLPVLDVRHRLASPTGRAGTPPVLGARLHAFANTGVSQRRGGILVRILGLAIIASSALFAQRVAVPH